MNHVYKVPVIPQNLSKQETIVQVAEVLNHLSNVTEDILKRINDRIDLDKEKISNISDRVEKVNKKIQKLSGAKKATQVFSSCRYPASDINQQYISIFSDVKPQELVRHKVKHKKAPFNEEQLDKLYVYHVKVKKNANKGTVNGLGEIPQDIDCVNDLLLYNSGKNLYTNFVMSDALAITQEIIEQEQSNTSSIGAAPHSISERSTVTRPAQNYFYTPNLGEVPALDVPLDLPDLPNIADDLRYDLELDPGIAPSVTTTPNIPDLPVIEEQTESARENEPEIELPPPLPLPTIQPEKVEETVAVPVIKETPKPPTPPVEEETLQKMTELPQVDIHASLMEAIRKAGGTKNLKSTTDKHNVPKKPITGGDLMADLHAKLSMRRKGISGAKKQDLDASSALEKISAMIPPPAASEINENNTEDEDWDD